MTKKLKTGDKVVLHKNDSGDCAKLAGIEGTLVIQYETYYIVFAKDTKLPRGQGWNCTSNEHLAPYGTKAWCVYAPTDLKAATAAPKKIKPSAMTILKHLQRGLTISPAEALRVYKNSRLAASIWDLKQAGYDISKEMRQDLTGQRYARYSLVGNA